MNPLVSIIVTTYNRMNLLEETIKSILNQSITDFELIVIDNFSDYDFFVFIEKFNDMRIRPFQNFNNSIISINRNYGINLALGEFISFCDDDDIWISSKLADQLFIMEKNPSVSICSTSFSYIGIDNIHFLKNFFISLRNFALGLNIFPAKYIIILIPFVATSSVILRKKIIDEIGFFSEDPFLVSMEDYDFWLRIFQKEKFYFLNKKLFVYRIHNNQNSNYNFNLFFQKLKLVYNLNYYSFDILQKIIFKFKYNI